MVKFLISRPVSVFVVYLAFALLAIVSTKHISISLLPDINVPEIVVLSNYEDASAREIENMILRPLRRQLLKVSGVESIESTASDASGMLRIRFFYSRNMDYALLEVNEKVDQALSFLPEQLERPRVIKTQSGTLPVFYLSLSSENTAHFDEQDFLELSAFTEQIVRRRFEQLKSVAFVDISGTTEDQIAIRPNEALMMQFGITQEDITQSLKAANLSLGSITIKERDYQYKVRLGQELSDIRDIKAIPIRIENQVYKLSEIADINVQSRPVTGLYISNEQRAISLAFIKSSAARMKVFQNDVKSLVEDLKGQYPEIKFTFSNDQTKLLDSSISNLRQSLLIGAVLAIFIVFLFYKDFVVPIIVGIIVPLSILISILFFDFLGLSLNIISLSGLILGLGLMIDNGIIVMDNIYQFSLTEKSYFESCIAGTNEMIRPLLSSMLTTCSVFLPLLLLNDISGALFFDQAITVSLSLFISYLISITLLPTLFFVLKRNIEVDKKSNGINWHHAYYSACFKFMFKFPFILWALAITLLICGYYTFNKLKVERLPELPQKAFEAYIEWNESLTIEAVAKRTKSFLKQRPDYYNAHIGQQKYILNHDPNHKGNVTHLYIECNNTKACEGLQSTLRGVFKEKFPLASIHFLPRKTVFEKIFPKDGTSISPRLKVLDISNTSSLMRDFKEIKKRLREELPDLELENPVWENYFLIVPDFEKLMFYDIEVRNLSEELKSAFSNNLIFTLTNTSNSLRVVINSSNQNLNEVISTFKIKNNNGVFIPIKYLVKIRNDKSLKEITAYGGGEYVPLVIQGENLERLIPFFNDFQLSNQNSTIELTGTFFRTQKIQEEMFGVLIISIVLLYFIMAAQFESLIQPLIILLEIPISLSGSLLLLYFGGASLNAMALIGMVMTTGIIINDSIVKLDTVNRLVKNGNMSIKEALHQGGIKRLNPILMTSFTTIFAVVPFLFSESLGAVLQKPLTLALIGGMIIGTLTSLYMIPAIYYFMYKNKKHDYL